MSREATHYHAVIASMSRRIADYHAEAERADRDFVRAIAIACLLGLILFFAGALIGWKHATETLTRGRMICTLSDLEGDK